VSSFTERLSSVRSAEQGKPACGRSEGRLVCLGDGLAAGPLERAGDIIPACWKRGARELVEHLPDQGERGGIRSGSCGEGDGHVQVVESRRLAQLQITSPTADALGNEVSAG
jgi:hypothetical protein